jgi:hypothetical protein
MCLRCSSGKEFGEIRIPSGKNDFHFAWNVRLEMTFLLKGVPHHLW